MRKVRQRSENDSGLAVAIANVERCAGYSLEEAHHSAAVCQTWSSAFGATTMDARALPPRTKSNSAAVKQRFEAAKFSRELADHDYGMRDSKSATATVTTCASDDQTERSKTDMTVLLFENII